MITVPVVLAGGKGTRLWPLSRETHPKQFLRLTGEHSLLQQTLQRLPAGGDIQAPLIICHQSHYFLCLEQVAELDLTAKYIVEPISRNTAPAIAMAAWQIQTHYGEDAVMVVLPSDHHMDDIKHFNAAVSRATALAGEGSLVTFGIQPRSPKTGYGYIKVAADGHRVEAFVEKPDQVTAKKLVSSGDYLWNSGMFVFTAGAYLSELKKFAPEIYAVTKKACEAVTQHNDDWFLDKALLADCPSDSIDYAIMEKTAHAAVVPLELAWNDLGCWQALSETGEQDENNNVVSGSVLAADTTNCLLRAEHGVLATVGLNDHVVVSTKDSVLVAHKDHTQQVKELVERLRQDHADLTTHHARVHRPWGHFETLIEGDHFKVKLLTVQPGQQLSLQMHQHRAEHWVVVSGVADVICGDEKLQLKANQSTYIPKQTKHRLGNSGGQPLQIVEVQSGDYLGEDDITRFEDKYSRSESPDLAPQ